MSFSGTATVFADSSGGGCGSCRGGLVQDGGRVDTAAAFEFQAGTTITSGVAGRLGWFCFGRGRRVEPLHELFDVNGGKGLQGCGVDGVFLFNLFDFREIELGIYGGGDAGGDLFRVGDAEVTGFELRREGFYADAAFGLQAAEFGGGPVEDAEGLGAGAVDGGLDFGEAGVEGGVGGVFLSFFVNRAGYFDQIGFDVGAAAETPGSAEDLDGVGSFEGVLWVEAVPESGGEFVVLGFVLREDEVAGGEEVEFAGVLGGGCFSGFGAGAGGGLGVTAIGFGLRGG